MIFRLKFELRVDLFHEPENDELNLLVEFVVAVAFLLPDRRKYWQGAFLASES